VARCDTSIQAVRTKYGKSVKRLQQKLEALAASRELCSKARAEHERAKLRHESDVAQVESAQVCTGAFNE